MTVSTRNATRDDIPQIVEILNYYILNSVASLRYDPITPIAYHEIFDKVESQRLPFVVATDSDFTDAKVIAFCYATGFGIPAGYLHAVEISIYVAADARTKGAGSKLMGSLMNSLQRPMGEGAPRIKQILSLMTLDQDGPGGGYGLRDWYGRWGFVQVGHMKRVGFKFGRWMDVLILQASIEDGE